MAAPYATVPITGYNSNPPVDDGTETEANRLKWSTIKTKLPDPIKTRTDSMDTAIIAAFAKVLGGGAVTSAGVSYQVVSGDQGKLVRATVAGITITTPDATDVDDPFVFGVLNNSGGDITLDGSGAQTIDGAANVTIPSGAGLLAITDGTNWFTFGQSGLSATSGFSLLGGILVPSVAGNALTIAIKTLAGADPSTDTPVRVTFRGQTLLDEEYVVRTITAATSLVIPSTATMGVTATVPFRLWLTLHDDGGTLRLGASNRVTASGIVPFSEESLASTTAVGTGSDSAGVIYTGSAVTSKPFRILGYLEWSTGLAVAGTWSDLSTKVAMFSPGMKKPGDLIQAHRKTLTDTQTTTSTTLADITGASVTIPIQGAPNLVEITGALSIGAGDAVQASINLVRGSTSIGMGDAAGNRVRVMTESTAPGGNNMVSCALDYIDAPGAAGDTTYKLQWRTQNTIFLNRSSDDSDAATRSRGSSTLKVVEYCA